MEELQKRKKKQISLIEPKDEEEQKESNPQKASNVAFKILSVLNFNATALKFPANIYQIFLLVSRDTLARQAFHH